MLLEVRRVELLSRSWSNNMDKNAITVKDVVELALIELQYMAADFSQRRKSTSDPLERAALDIQLANIRMAMVAIEFTLEAIRIPSDRSEHLKGAPTARRRRQPRLLSRFPSQPSSASPASAARE